MDVLRGTLNKPFMERGNVGELTVFACGVGSRGSKSRACWFWGPCDIEGDVLKYGLGT